MQSSVRPPDCLTAWIPVCGDGRGKKKRKQNNKNKEEIRFRPMPKTHPETGLMQTEGDVQRWKFKEARKCLRVYVRANPIVEPHVNLEMLSKCHTGEKVWFGELSNKCIREKSMFPIRGTSPLRLLSRRYVYVSDSFHTFVLSADPPSPTPHPPPSLSFTAQVGKTITNLAREALKGSRQDIQYQICYEHFFYFIFLFHQAVRVLCLMLLPSWQHAGFV